MSTIPLREHKQKGLGTTELEKNILKFYQNYIKILK